MHRNSNGWLITNNDPNLSGRGVSFLPRIRKLRLQISRHDAGYLDSLFSPRKCWIFPLKLAHGRTFHIISVILHVIITSSVTYPELWTAPLRYHALIHWSTSTVHKATSARWGRGKPGSEIKAEHLGTKRRWTLSITLRPFVCHVKGTWLLQEKKKSSSNGTTSPATLLTVLKLWVNW
jgi:hypothetical protein